MALLFKKKNGQYIISFLKSAFTLKNPGTVKIRLEITFRIHGHGLSINHKETIVPFSNKLAFDLIQLFC